MENKKKNLTIEKFRIAELKRPDYIIGGGDDDGTVGTDRRDEDKKCLMDSKVWVKKKER